MKYELNDTLWIMRSNRPCDVRVIGRQATEIMGQLPTYSYQCQYEDGLIRWEWEHDLFPSEAALKEAL
jgi:hypothetical protein